MDDNYRPFDERVDEPAVTVEEVETVEEEVLEQATPAGYQETEDETGQRLSWLEDDLIDELQSRWNSVQIEFVDDPLESVKQADALVAEALKRIEQELSHQRTKLNGRWTNQEVVSTEDLRIVLQRYRSFFDRLLAL